MATSSGDSTVVVIADVVRDERSRTFVCARSRSLFDLHSPLSIGFAVAYRCGAELISRLVLAAGSNPMSYSYCPDCGEGLETVAHEGEQRLACPDEACGFVHFDNPTPVVAAIVEREGRVVLVQNEEWPDDWYALVSGFLESGESPREGMLREIREEILLEAEIQSLVGLYSFEMMNQLLIVYHVTVEDEPEVGDELSDLTEVPIEDVQPWDEGTGPALADWLEEQ